MATIQKRIANDGSTTYRARVRLKGYPVESASFARLTDAKEWAQQTETAIRDGRYFKKAEAKKHTLGEMIDRYLETLQLRNPKRAEHVKPYLDWWKTKLGVRLLSDITRPMLIEHRDKLLKKGRHVEKRTPSTANRYMTALSTAFTMAVNEWEWVSEHPMQKIAKLAEPRGRVRFLSDEERERLLKACEEVDHERLYLLVVLALSTGARHGELRNLWWEHVDFTRKVIVLHDTKNKERRVLPLAHHALDLITERYKNRNAATPLVFPMAGAPLKPWRSRYHWLQALEKAKLTDFRFHDLRHSAASYLAMNGASLAEIAEVLGHKTLAMVKRYAHLSEAHTASVVERMNKKIFK